MTRYMIQVRATAMSEAGDFPDDPTLVPRMMAFHDEMAKAGVLLDGAGLQPSSQGFRVQYDAAGQALVVEVISKGAAQSWQMENRYKTMIADKFDFGFAVDWMRKDLGLALEERPFRLEEAFGAREALMSSATTIVLPIVAIDGRTVGDGRPGPTAQALRHRFPDIAQRG